MKPDELNFIGILLVNDFIHQEQMVLALSQVDF